MAKTIRLEALEKAFPGAGGEILAVDGVSLEIPAGSFTTIVGPSGCGKTTTLRMIAGLEEPSGGAIYFDEEEVTELPPQRRNLSMVFQNIALFPHMNVRENIGYGLKIAGVPRDERDARVEEAARVLQITEQLDKMPAALSGGQQQRVALGAAFVKDPDILLLDEPMSDLDAKLKADLRVEVQRLHQEMDATLVYVTHDQTEAMTMSDHVVVMRDGRVEQFDAAMELFHHPVSRYVAEFIGTPATNVLDYEVVRTDGTLALAGYGHAIPVPVPGDALSPYEGRTVAVGIRPQYLTPEGGEYALDATVDVVEPLGTESVVHARVGDERLDMVTSDVTALEPGDRFAAGFDRGRIYVFAPDGGTVLYGDALASEATRT